MYNVYSRKCLACTCYISYFHTRIICIIMLEEVSTTITTMYRREARASENRDDNNFTKLQQ